MASANRAKLVSLLLGLVMTGATRAAFAQVSLVGDWVKAEGARPIIGESELGDYTALPIRPDVLQSGDAWSESRWTQLNRGCSPYGVAQAFRGPAIIRIAEERNSATQALVALKTFIATFAQERTIWMDGRPHPSKYAAHTWQGFSTGRWNGNVLTVTTTHIKQFWHRRNGILASDNVRVTEHFFRHGNYLTYITISEDPAYLTEPLVYSEVLALSLDVPTENWQTHLDCQPDEEIAGRPKGYVPHWLPGSRAHSEEFAKKYGIPVEATRGGAETMYPEYIATLKKSLEAAAGRPARSRNRDPGPARETQHAEAGEMDAVPVQNGVYLIAGGGGNVAVHVGDTGLVVVDTGAAQMSEQVLAAIRRLSPLPVRYIINTSADSDHTGGNETVDKAGEAARTRELIEEGSVIVAHENVLKRMSAPTGQQSPTPVAAWPTVTFFTPQKDLYLNEQAVQVIHQPAAHTDGDSLVFFRRSDVVVAGDIFDKTRYPLIDRARGGSINGTIDALNRLLDLTVAGQYEEGGTMVIPGHGRISDEADVVEYRDMVTIIRDRIADLVKQGRTLEQVKAARPTAEYDPMYGASSGSWTTEMFVEAVFRDLVADTTK